MDKLTDSHHLADVSSAVNRRWHLAVILITLSAGSLPFHAHASNTDDDDRCHVKVNTDRGKGGWHASDCTADGQQGADVGFSGTFDDMTWTTPFGGRYAFLPNLGPSLGDLARNTPNAVGKGIHDGLSSAATGLNDGFVSMAKGIDDAGKSAVKGVGDGASAIGVAGQQAGTAVAVATVQSVQAATVVVKQSSTVIHDGAGWVGDRLGVHW